MGKPRRPDDPTLAEVLTRLGWSYSSNTASGLKPLVTTDNGEVLRLTAGECWELLRERGLYPEEVSRG